MIKAKLVVVGGARETDVELRQLPTTIGRAREATITLPHNLVSRRHCEIFEQNGQLYVKDLNSLNGTYLNNEKIAGTQPLLPNQLLTLGNVTFRALYESEVDAEMPIAPPNAELDHDSCATDDWQQGETIASDLRANNHSDYLTSGNENAIPIDEADTDHAVGTFKRVDDDQAQGTDSRVLVIGDEEPSRDKSISLGALEQLPQERLAASFAGGVEIDMIDAPVARVDDETVQIDLGEEARIKEASKSKLDSFLRKLPK